MITLKAEAVYSELRKVTEGTYKSGPNKDAAYVVMSHGKRGFTLPKEVFQEWENGDIAELSLEETNYDRKVIDPETGAENLVNTPSLTYSGSISNKQQVKVATHQGRLQGIKAAIAKDYKLDAATLEAAI